MNFPWAPRVGASMPSGQPNSAVASFGSRIDQNVFGVGTVRFQTVERPKRDLGRTCNHAVTAALGPVRHG